MAQNWNLNLKKQNIDDLELQLVPVQGPDPKNPKWFSHVSKLTLGFRSSVVFCVSTFSTEV